MAVIVPTLRHERRLWNEGLTRVVGVDEVGVAPTCGAVVAAAVIMKPGCHRIPGVRDSKTLSMAQRERLAPIIRKRAVAVGVGAASVREIDQLNIYHATHLAMRRAIARLGGHDHVIVDGNRIVGFEAQVGPYTNIVDGDAKVYSIACASVVAKVVRDRMMTRLAARYPGYGWEHNQGYATRDHRDAIRGTGPHAVPSPLVPRPPADARRRPARLRPARRSRRVADDPRAARARVDPGHGRRRGARRRRPASLEAVGLTRISRAPSHGGTPARDAAEPVPSSTPWMARPSRRLGPRSAGRRLPPRRSSRVRLLAAGWTDPGPERPRRPPRARPRGGRPGSAADARGRRGPLAALARDSACRGDRRPPQAAASAVARSVA